MFLNSVTCMLVVLFFLCVRKHESKVPTNILRRILMGEVNAMFAMKTVAF